MGVVLEDLYKDKKYKDLKLIAGNKGIRNIVRWIYVIESIETANHLQGREIILTTGIGLSTKDNFIDFVKTNVKNNASGMIINIGQFIKEVDNEIINYCNKVNFPLFILSQDTDMLDIIKDFSTSIIESEKINMELRSAALNALFFPQDEELYIPTFQRNGYKEEWPYCVSAIEVNIEENLQTKNYLKQVQSQIEYAIELYCRNTFLFLVNEMFILVFANHSVEETKSIMINIKNYLYNKFNLNNMYIGIGEQTKNIKCIYKSYNYSKCVVKLNKRKDKVNEVMTYNECGIYKLLMSIEDDKVLKSYYQEILGSLVEYDKVHKTDYMNVLLCYLKNNASVNKAASELFVHRNTINYKINKIEEIIKCNLSQLETRVNILMAYKIKEIL